MTMRQELKRYSSIGDKKGILFLCQKVLTASQVNLQSVRSACSFVNGIDLNFPCGILALEELKLLLVNGSKATATSLVYDNNDKDSFVVELCKHSFEILGKEELFDDSLVAYDEQHDGYYIPRKAFKLESAVFRNMLISLGALRNEGSKFVVSHDYESLFKEVVRKKRKLSLSQLIEKLEEERLMGEEGERFVLDYERSRCNFSQSQLDRIKQISEVDVSAGYDIISFHEANNEQRRYIEVKTYNGKTHFHWSVNEISSSKLRRKNYYIYLVDYTKINDNDYKPTLICDPYQEVFVENKWQYSVDSYLVEDTQV